MFVFADIETPEGVACVRPLHIGYVEAATSWSRIFWRKFAGEDINQRVQWDAVTVVEERHDIPGCE